jgi:hypothetical protein
VQIKTVKIELQRILKVPRTVGAYTRLTTSVGIVQLGWNVLAAEPSPERRNRPPSEERMVVYNVQLSENEIRNKKLELIVECENTVSGLGVFQLSRDNELQRQSDAT